MLGFFILHPSTVLVRRSWSAKPRATRHIFDPALGEAMPTPLFWRFDLNPGSVVEGPAIIAEDETSTVVGANFRAVINALGYIVLRRK